MSCSLLNHNLVAKSWIQSFIVKLKFTIVKIIKTQYKVKKKVSITLYVYYFSFFIIGIVCLV
jgi:Ca2+/Na+ antiporter